MVIGRNSSTGAIVLGFAVLCPVAFTILAILWFIAGLIAKKRVAAGWPYEPPVPPSPPIEAAPAYPISRGTMVVIGVLFVLIFFAFLAFHEVIEF